MKLGEALSLRALQAQQLSDLRQRINVNVTGQEGSTPSEDPSELLGQFKKLSEEHAELIRRITLTNVTDGILDSLQRREHLRRVRNVLEGASRGANQVGAIGRYMRSELKSISFVSVAALQEEIEKLTEDIRVLDAQIQQRNWDVELLGTEQ